MTDLETRDRHLTAHKGPLPPDRYIYPGNVPLCMHCARDRAVKALPCSECDGEGWYAVCASAECNNAEQEICAFCYGTGKAQLEAGADTERPCQDCGAGGKGQQQVLDAIFASARAPGTKSNILQVVVAQATIGTYAAG